MAKRDLTLEASADIDIGGLPLTVALSRRPDPDTQLLDVLLEVRLNLTGGRQSISLKKILSALFGSSVGDELGLNIELQLDKVAIELYLQQKKIVFVVTIRDETNFKELGVKEKEAKDGKQSSPNQEAKQKIGVLIIKQKGQKAKICFFVQPDDFLEQKSTSLEEEASKWTKICYVKLKKWEEEEEEQEKEQNKKQEKEPEKEQNKKQDPTSKKDAPSKPSSSGASSSSSGSEISRLIDAIKKGNSLIGVFGQFADLEPALLTIGGLIAGKSCSTIAEALKHTYNTAHKSNETQPLALPIPDKKLLLGLVLHSPSHELSAYKNFIDYYQYYCHHSETQSLLMSGINASFFCQLMKNMPDLKFAQMADLLQNIGYEPEESAQALHTVYSDVNPLEMGITLKKTWTKHAINATEMARILAKLYGIIPAIESYVEDLKAKGSTATEAAKKLKENLPKLTSEQLSEFLSKSYSSADIKAAIQEVFLKHK
jgi:hypothetical protein